jgi:peptidoglycan/LPS O-acetylase OafA/YrhL
MSINFLAQLPVFATGLLVYSAIRPKKGEGEGKWLVVGALATFCIELSLFVMSPSKPRLVPTHCIMGSLFAVLALILAKYPVRLLVNPVTTFVGKISFGMYLTHFVVLHGVTGLHLRFFPGWQNVGSVVHFLLIVVVTVSLSYLLYETVENPMIKVGKRLIARWEMRDRVS